MLLTLILALAPAHAFEGMYPPAELTTLPPGQVERLAGIDISKWSDPLGDPLGAIVQLQGCSASFVSPDGLIVTNHHCVSAYLTQARREGENLVGDGFHAPTLQDERSAGPAARVWVTRSIVEVTPSVLGGISAKTTDVDRALKIEANQKKLIAGCEKPGGVRCRVASFYEGRSYSLVTQAELRDLRLVYVPPDAVGNYGDEIDNWHWPRHSGDFAFLRAYTAPDGKTADYAATNIPFHPQHYLKAGAGPTQAGLIAVAGYPSVTGRWRTAAEVTEEANFTMPLARAEMAWALEMWAIVSRTGPEAKAQLADVTSKMSNVSSKYEGMLEGYRRTKVVERMTARDAGLDAWVAADPARTARYAAALAELRAKIAEKGATRDRDRTYGYLMRSDLLGAAQTIYKWSKNQALSDAKREPGFQARDRARTLANLEELDHRYVPAAERRWLKHFLTTLLALPDGQRIPELEAWIGGRDEAAIDKALDRMFGGPVLANKDQRLASFDLPAATLAASTDGFLSLAAALAPYDERQRQADLARAGAYARLRPLHAEALAAFDPARSYPDANGTLRLTFGYLTEQDPRDAVHYSNQTTVMGVAEKAGEWPYNAPTELLAAIEQGRASNVWGRYADPELKTVPVDFLSDVDITGGNSGSPTLNTKGEWIGLVFDTNWEGVSSATLRDAEQTRSIHVDVRYILWYLENVARADRVLKELGQ